MSLVHSLQQRNTGQEVKNYIQLDKSLISLEPGLEVLAVTLHYWGDKANVPTPPIPRASSAKASKILRQTGSSSSD